MGCATKIVIKFHYDVIAAFHAEVAVLNAK